MGGRAIAPELAHAHISGRTPSWFVPPTLLATTALVGVMIISLLHPSALAGIHSPSLDVTLTVATLVVAGAAAYFAFAGFVLRGHVSGLLLGLGFALFVGADLGMGVLPVLRGHHTLSLVAYGWAIQLAAVGALFAAAAIFASRTTRLDGRLRLAFLLLLVVTLFSVLMAFMVDQSPAPPAGRDGQVILQLIAAALFFVAAIRFRAAGEHDQQVWYGWLTLCFLTGAFAQIEYAIYPFQFGTVQAGDILRLLALTGILIGLAGEWSIQYRRIHLQAEELEALAALVHSPGPQDVAGTCRHIASVVGDTLGGQVTVILAGQEVPHADPLLSEIVHMHDGSRSVTAGQVVTAYETGDTERVALGAGLTSGDRRLGTLIAVRQGGEAFTGYDIRLIRAFAAHASVLVERSLLYEEAAAGAVLQERSRLAREIHDGLAQHLAFLKMRVAWMQRGGRTIPASDLADIEGVLETALVEARHAITTLRAQPDGTSMVEAIRSYVDEFGQVARICTEVLATGIPEVRPQARVEVLRIVQEALNNVRKHAGATRVSVTIESLSDRVSVAVRDNGNGFPSGEHREGHYGLEIMRERAQSLGGDVVIMSAPGQGTEVRVSVPLGLDVETVPARPAQR